MPSGIISGQFIEYKSVDDEKERNNLDKNFRYPFQKMLKRLFN